MQTPGLTYLIVRGRGHDHYAELPDADVGATAEFQAIGEDPGEVQSVRERGGGGCLSNAAAVERKNRARASSRPRSDEAFFHL